MKQIIAFDGGGGGGGGGSIFIIGTTCGSVVNFVFYMSIDQGVYHRTTENISF
jgi:hypothetical protein